MAKLRRAVRENHAGWVRMTLEHEPPGTELGELLASLDPAGLDLYDLVSHIGACERQTAWVQARQLSAVRELAGRRLVPGPHGEPADSAFPDGMINEFAADEVAAQLSLSRRAGQKRVWLATALTRLPATAAAFAAGQLTLSKVWAIAESLSVLDEDAATEAETRVLGRAPDQTLSNLKRCLARAVVAADPTAAQARAVRARAERRVILTPLPDGMCEFWALLPAPDAMALWAAVTAMADEDEPPNAPTQTPAPQTTKTPPTSKTAQAPRRPKTAQTLRTPATPVAAVPRRPNSAATARTTTGRPARPVAGGGRWISCGPTCWRIWPTRSSSGTTCRVTTAAARTSRSLWPPPPPWAWTTNPVSWPATARSPPRPPGRSPPRPAGAGC